MDANPDWEAERRELLGQRISDLGLRIAGSPLEPMIAQLYDELAAKGLLFRPPVYLSDEWGCPNGLPLIGVPFYLADARLARIEEEVAVAVENREESLRFLRHEAGHAFNYAYRLYDREDWRRAFGPYSRPYRERFHVDPLSRDYVRHILGWYAQKHPDEDFAETFAVWLTPDSAWRDTYAAWPALTKLEYVERVMAEVGAHAPDALQPRPEHMPVEAMHYTVAEHYTELEQTLPVPDPWHFDGDLRTIFENRNGGEPAGRFIRRHRREIVSRIAYWTGEPATVAKAFVDFLAERADALGLHVSERTAAALIELTAFGTAVLMNYRYTDAVGRPAQPAT